MDKINLQNNDEYYRIEVNDNGDYIEFDLLDIELPLKISNLAKTLKKMNDTYKTKLIALEKSYKDNQELFIQKYTEAERDFYTRLRQQFDTVLGENACMKIFGQKNRFGMFERFFEELEPYFENMKINTEKLKDKMLKKYGVTSSDTL